MTLQESALTAAGVLGSTVTVVHGVLLQRLGVRKLDRIMANAEGLSAAMKRLLSPLLHFTTFNWFVGGIALIAAARSGGESVRLAVGLLVGSSYLYGVIFNAWATRFRHPGWFLYAITVGLIGIGLS
jgi:hypothetical protein